MGHERAFKAYQRNAKRRKIGFTLTLEEFTRLVEKPCVFCGTHAGGVDRRDSRLGYYPENSQSCCGTCNRLKSNFQEYFFLSHVDKICRHQQKKREAKFQPVVIPNDVQEQQCQKSVN